jgi:hypothetical protein
MPQRKPIRKPLSSTKKPKAVKLETYGSRLDVDPLRKKAEKFLKDAQKIKSGDFESRYCIEKPKTDWRWLLKDWRVWTLAFLIVASIVLAVLARGGSEVISKTKSVPTVAQESAQVAAFAPSLWIAFTLIGIVGSFVFARYAMQTRLSTAISSSVMTGVLMFVGRNLFGVFSDVSKQNSPLASNSVEVNSLISSTIPLIFLAMTLGLIVSIFVKMNKLFR